MKGIENQHQIQITATNTSSSSPTTFIQTDRNTFRDLVQKLTGSTTESDNKLHHARLSSAKHSFSGSITAPRRSPFKLQERRNTTRNLEIELGITSLRNSPRGVLRDESQAFLSPVTPFTSDSLFFRCPDGTESPEEEKAIANKGYYLHPSPLSTPRAGKEPPELLPLFPLSSPGDIARG